VSAIAIRCERLSKRYGIGPRPRHATAREAVSNAAAALGRRLWGRRPAGAEPTESEHVWALRDLDFEIRRGEAVGIIGRNGAGKTTLLRILSRITEPTAGRAEIRGRVGSLLEVGTGFHPELTGRENIYLNGAILGMRRSEIRARFDEIVEFAEIERFIDTPVKRYSSGMYVRLAFAVAAHLEPEVLLVDEVLAVGDAAFQKKCLGRMSEIGYDGRTVLLVSHNMAAITALASRCLYLSAGGLVADGQTGAVVSRYLAESVVTDHGGIVDLRKVVRRPSGSHPDVELTELRLTDDRQVPGQYFHEGDPVHIMVSFEVRRPILQFEINLIFSTTNGVRLFSVASGRRAWTLKPGRYGISTRLDPNLLRPGLYNLSLGVSSSVWQDGGYDVAALEVTDNPMVKDKPYPIGGDFGVLHLPYEWTEPSRA
jgi:lipopolysaccharide transport system ATP-binding protein